MSSRPEAKLLHDPRLDCRSNLALNRAESLRIGHFAPPPVVTSGILLLSLLEVPSIKEIPKPNTPLHIIKEWAYNYSLLDNFEPYENDNWQRDLWDQHVDRAIEAAFQVSQANKLLKAPPELLLKEVVLSDPIQNIWHSYSALQELHHPRSIRSLGKTG